ncbi:MAG: hypothetical protein EZS28_033898 [Streblomastix strix]|uniref:Reverse transcriptase domain-containing protein n=1 Tax=Streblomastix strix TaxID=222440 RepID=A0A5J4UIW2_9EUKA|nr:MAG: hypothetical protein EZS28_033898 [Streblomastix strix]
MSFHHIPIDPAFRPFQGFHHNNHFFRYKAMSFSVKFAPLIFNQTLKHLMKLIKERPQIHCIAYCDDLLFLSQSSQEQEVNKALIISVLEQFGWKLSEKKAILEPQLPTKFLSWKKHTHTDQIRLRENKRWKIEDVVIDKQTDKYRIEVNAGEKRNICYLHLIGSTF